MVRKGFWYDGYIQGPIPSGTTGAELDNAFAPDLPLMPPRHPLLPDNEDGVDPGYYTTVTDTPATYDYNDNHFILRPLPLMGYLEQPPFDTPEGLFGAHPSQFVVIEDELMVPRFPLTSEAGGLDHQEAPLPGPTPQAPYADQGEMELPLRPLSTPADLDPLLVPPDLFGLFAPHVNAEYQYEQERPLRKLPEPFPDEENFAELFLEEEFVAPEHRCRPWPKRVDERGGFPARKDECR